MKCYKALPGWIGAPPKSHKPTHVQTHLTLFSFILYYSRHFKVNLIHFSPWALDLCTAPTWEVFSLSLLTLGCCSSIRSQDSFSPNLLVEMGSTEVSCHGNTPLPFRGFRILSVRKGLLFVSLTTSSVHNMGNRASFCSTLYL